MPTLTINEATVTVPDGTTVLRAALANGIHIPHYCWHPHLSIAGNCRMCLVEIEKAPKLVTSCNTPVAEGMVVRTDSEPVKKAVRGVLEMILLNHPVDCPICDQAGECGLQDYYMRYGLHKSRVGLDEKVHKKKVKRIGGDIVLDAERCILCSRCVRFLREVTGTGELEIVNRGTHSEISIFPGVPLSNDYTGNLADICPVGALTSDDFRFKCRVWFLTRHSPSICPGCSNGCDIEVHHHRGVVHRLKPRENEAVNGAWMCDFGRKSYKAVNDGRVLSPMNRHGGSLEKTTWDEALAEVAREFKSAKRGGGENAVAVVASPFQSNEELYLTKTLCDEVLDTKAVGFSSRVPGDGFADELLIKSDKTPNANGSRALGFTEERFEAIVEAIGRGEVRFLLLFGHHLGARSADEVAELLAKVPFVVQVATNESAAMKGAHVLLPSASWVERSGTWVNHAGRVQRFRAAMPPHGEARRDLQLIASIANALGAGWGEGLRDTDTVFRRMAGRENAFAGLSYETVGTLGTAMPGQAGRRRTDG